MKRERRQFDMEFKMMAVNLCLTGKATQDIADELDSLCFLAIGTNTHFI
jgi:transposase-like protein